MPLIRQIEDRWIAWTVVRVKILDASPLFSLLVRVRRRPYLASLYISKSTACKTSSATRGSREDRAPCARCTRLRSKQNGSHRSRFIVFSPLRCFPPRVLASRSLCGRGSSRVTHSGYLSRVCRFCAQRRDRSSCSSRSKVLRDFFETIAGSSLSGCQVFSRVTLCFT